MARARNIKPSFFQNEELGELNPLARLAFIGMWTISDFKGCIELRVKRLKIQLLPYDECDFEEIVNNLEQYRFISTYSVLGQRYIKIINFEKHQNPHKNERESGSEIPDITERDENSNKIINLDNIENNLDKNVTARADSLNPLTDSLLLIPDSPIPISEEKHTPLASLIALGVSKKSAQDWLKIRKSKKLILTDDALDLFKSECLKAGISPADAVKKCNQESWGGFKAEWLIKKDNVKPLKGHGVISDESFKEWLEPTKDIING